MNLEITAYVFGIIGAIATVWNLYYAWKNDRLNKYLPGSEKIERIEEQPIPGEEKEKQITEIISSNTNDIKSLKIAFRSAKKMQFAKPLDDALKEIVKKAVRLKEFKFALEVTQKAQFAVALDEMLMIIVDEALIHADYKIAEVASNRFYFARGMDIAKRKIVNALK